MRRDIRHQAAVVRDHHILLINVHDHNLGFAFWLLPGGGRESDESGEQCVCREVLEETGLQVVAEQVLVDEAIEDDDTYDRIRTYLCHPAPGDPVPGHEPEGESWATILEARWFDLRNLDQWLPEVLGDELTMRWIRPIRAALR